MTRRPRLWAQRPGWYAVLPIVRANNLALRLGTALVFIPVLTAIMFLAPPVVWYACVALAILLAAIELFAMTHPGDRVAQGIGVVTTLGVSLAVYFFAGDARVLLAVLFAVPMLGMLAPLWRLGAVATAGFRQLAGVGGPIYVGGLLTPVAMLQRDFGEVGPEYVVLTLTCAWLGDSGGYFFGRYFGRGKAKLYPEISPAKTRIGFLGGIVGNVAAALLASCWYLPELPVLHGVVLALAVGALGQLGDLAESLLKRSCGFKDSGWILPGHGGLLDRLDAVAIVGPIVYFYALWAHGAPWPVPGR